MSYSSPSNDLDKCEIYDYLSLKLPLTEIIRQAWKDGFEWGQELGYEKAIDKIK